MKIKGYHDSTSCIQPLKNFLPSELGLEIAMLREDKIDAQVSGNKYRKLKYNLLEAHKHGRKSILSFGGAYSNHIAALAYAGKKFDIQTIGVIRGDELAGNAEFNPTLTFAKECGMKLHFVSRETYRNKDSHEILENLMSTFGDCYILPEGGTNDLAIKGCTEILSEETAAFNIITVPVGTGGTIAGLVLASSTHQQVIGFSALQGTFQSNIIQEYTKRTNYKILDNFCFGGYGKIEIELIRFINRFKKNYDIPLDPLYTGKMMYGILELAKDGFFPKNSRILAVHTGGLQGIQGMNQLLKKKQLPQID